MVYLTFVYSEKIVLFLIKGDEVERRHVDQPALTANNETIGSDVLN